MMEDGIFKQVRKQKKQNTKQTSQQTERVHAGGRVLVPGVCALNVAAM